MIAYIHSDEYSRLADCLPSNKGRSSVVHELISSYGLLENGVHVISPKPATQEQLQQFHDDDYVNCILNDRLSNKDHGLIDDCPWFDELADYVQFSAGASILGAQLLVSKTYQHVIHWNGGRHHAKQDSASGFCYVNDVVLAIEELRKSFQRVLYVDIDLHHGDAVQDAFYHSENVYTVSIHRYEPGGIFFPGTGSVEQRGKGRGETYCLNIPLREGLNDTTFKRIFDRTICQVYKEFQPNVVVVVSGCDGCASDPLKEWNLTQEAFEYTASVIRKWQLPTLWLGGGGYDNATAAKCWAAMTAAICQLELDTDIPEHNFMHLYAPSFIRYVDAGNRMDKNLNTLDDMSNNSTITQHSST